MNLPCRLGVLVMNSFSFCMSKKYFACFFKDIFTSYRILDDKFFLLFWFLLFNI